MGLFFDKIKKEAYFLIKKDCFVQSDKNFAIYYSYEPDQETVIKSHEYIFGIPVVKEKTINLRLPIKELCHGVYKMKI